MVYLESRSKRLRARRRINNLILFLILAALIAGAVYYRHQLLVLWQEIERVIRQRADQPDVKEILAETRREEYGIFCAGVEQANDCYLFDKKGVVFAKAKTVVGEVILRVDEVSDYKPIVAQKFLPAGEWENLFKILEFVKRRDWPAANFRLKREREELILDGAPKLLFSLRFDPAKHLTALTELKKKVKAENLSYIDLRVEDKIFYK